MNLEKPPLLINTWPEESGNYKLILVDILTEGDKKPNMVCQLDKWSVVHAGMLKDFLETLEVQFLKIKKGDLDVPAPSGDIYNAFGMGSLEVFHLQDQHPFARVYDFSQTYGLLISPEDKNQMPRLIEFQRENGVKLPDYRVLVRGTEVYSPKK